MKKNITSELLAEFFKWDLAVNMKKRESNTPFLFSLHIQGSRNDLWTALEKDGIDNPRKWVSDFIRPTCNV